ncbi:MAG: hypothetical protein M1837_007494 [Sclerophora amabilis]|nr:MAG: hypothetical protein M1837_007494 [Sclerophora amabilis]
MALESPLYPSPGGLVSAFSPYSDSPGSPALPNSARFPVMSSGAKDTLEPPHAEKSTESSSKRPQSPQPSPVTSNASTGTEIDGSTDEREPTEHIATPAGPSRQSEVTSIDTQVLLKDRVNANGTPQSVIHAPEGFKELSDHEVGLPQSAPPDMKNTPSPAQGSDKTARSPASIRRDSLDVISIVGVSRSEGDLRSDGSTMPQTVINSPVSPPPISTDVRAAAFALDNATPQAQTLQEAEAIDQGNHRKGRSSSLEDIPEAQDTEPTKAGEDITEDDRGSPSTTINNNHKADVELEIVALNTALDECWTLCNTLAGLSSIHRERIFNFAGSGDVQEHAWKSCWKLCQKLYNSREDNHESHIRHTLDLCRDFCQALFEVRQRENEVADSVLRVSFELNNHLYNTHDRNLPDAFRERTLDFYITLCHRLMKQRSGLAEETDSLLSACWSLAEMLFSLRQNKRDEKQADEELLGSAVQACWELCDLFREGWTQVRPDRGTPRPSQATFTQAFNQMKQSNYPNPNNPGVEPETPTTIFEDTNASPDGDEVTAPPNILVLGTEGQNRIGPRWSSNASTLSGYSQGSTHTSSTAKTRTTAGGTSEDINLTRLKVLIVKAAADSGFQRKAGQTLHAFVKSLTPNAFGNLPWQTNLLENYKKMVLLDPGLRTQTNMRPMWASAAQVARAVMWMVRGGQYLFLRDLFRLVFGCHLEEVETRENVIIEI